MTHPTADDESTVNGALTGNDALTPDSPDAPAGPGPRPGSRLARLAQPLAADVVHQLAISNKVCVRPVAMRVLDRGTGDVTFVDLPCGATFDSKCPSCAARAKALRMAQCREGWHLDTEPEPDRDPPTDDQLDLGDLRADLTLARDVAELVGDDNETAACATSIGVIDEELAESGVRGSLEPGTAAGKARRARSTRRRQDAPDLPKRPSNGSTLGRTFRGRGGVVYRPSMFVTLTLPSYGPVHTDDGTPLDPDRYDYRSAARDAIHIPKLLDRWVQNFRRVAGYDAQYFATLEPQRRLAPHAHIAIRGTIPRALLAQVTAATYHQVWWPPTDTVVYDDPLPWDDDLGGYYDPATGAALPTWDEALDTLDHDATSEPAEPLHVLRFGAQLDVKGLLAGTPEADRRIGYLCKYLTKHVSGCHGDDLTDRQIAHIDRLHAELRHEPCSPTCANWLRYGIQPKNARPGLQPGYCRGKAHTREHLGLGGRRVLVSRRWSGKTLADHRWDRRAFVAAALSHLTGLPGTDSDETQLAELTDSYRSLEAPGRLEWRPAHRDDPIPSQSTRLLHAIARRHKWRAHYERALALARGEPDPFVTPSPDQSAA